LILDEPTNHLDLESREALEDALHSFEGALLLVSHDRALLDAVGTRTVAIEEGSLRSFLGGWPEYVRVREERLASGGEAPKSQVAKPKSEKTASKAPAKQAKSEAKSAGPSKNRAREQDRAELAIEQAEAALQALEDELADPQAWATKYEAAKSEARHTAAKRAIEQAYERLEALVD
jgi:ATP-binding cassette subfamily F protein 3